MTKLEEIQDDLKKLAKDIQQVLLWQQKHDADSAAMIKEIDEVRTEMFGEVSDQTGGVKGKVRTMWLKCQGCSVLKQMIFKIFENVISATVVGFLFWVLYMYTIHNK